MLKVEEGQACGVLCAADDELAGPARSACLPALGVPRLDLSATQSRRKSLLKLNHYCCALHRRGAESSSGATPGQTRATAASHEPAASTTPFATSAPNGAAANGNGNGDTSVYDEYDEIDAYGDNEDGDAAAGALGSGSDGDTFSELSDPGGTEVGACYVCDTTVRAPDGAYSIPTHDALTS